MQDNVSLVHEKNWRYRTRDDQTHLHMYGNMAEERNSSIMVLTGRLKVKR